MVLLFVLFVGLGLLMIVKPALIWHIAERWKSADAIEPSDLYLFSTRFGGIMVTLLGVIGILVYTVLI